MNKQNTVTPYMASIIKLALDRGYKYVPIACYFMVNQGRIADVKFGRIHPSEPMADQLPADFPDL